MQLEKLEGVVYDLPEDEYHARPELSSTQARWLLESPAHYRWKKDHPQPRKDAFDLGTAVHTKVLGVGAAAIGYPEEHLTDSGRVSTKAATVLWEAEQRTAGLIILSESDLRKVDGMAEAVLRHPTARAVLEQAVRREASVFATDPETGVAERARFDFLPELGAKNPIAGDVKTTAKEASFDGFMKSVLNFGYDVQEGHYDLTLLHAIGEQIPFVFIVVETAAPHFVGIHQLDVVWREMGQAKAREARKRLAESTASGVWPSYPEEIQLLSPPVYAVYQHEEKFG